MPSQVPGAYIPTGYETQLGEIDRKRQIAEMLQQQSLTPDPGDQSYFSPLAKIAQAMIAKSSRQKADRMYGDVREQVRVGREAEMKRFQPLMMPQGGGKPDLAAIAQAVMTTTDPAIVAAAKPFVDAYAQQLKGGVEAKDIVNLRDPSGKVTSSQRFGDGSLTPLNGVEANKIDFTGQAGYDSLSGAPVVNAPDPEARVTRGAPKPGEVLGSPQINPLAVAADVQVAGAGAARTNNQTFINTGEKSYATQFGGKLADLDIQYLEGANGAPARYRTAGEVLKILDKAPTTGTFANQRLFLEKALSTAGIIDGQNVTDTETLAAQLASQTLTAIKSSGLGTGNGFTDKDRQFLQEASSGSLTMSNGSIRRLAELNQRSAVEAQKKAQIVVRRLRGSPATATFADQIEADIGEPLGNGGGEMTVQEYLAKNRGRK